MTSLYECANNLKRKLIFFSMFGVFFQKFLEVYSKNIIDNKSWSPTSIIIEEFNADNGVYMNVLNRAQEKKESSKFLNLYEEVTSSLANRNLIVLSHMPMVIGEAGI